MASIYKGSWLVGGDFNKVLKDREKHRGNIIITNRSKHFWSCLKQCKLVDLGFKGSKYTLNNKRKPTCMTLITFERLDRYFSIGEWIKSYAKAIVTHLTRPSLTTALFF